jgi:alpha-glucoside transport system permease protein
MTATATADRTTKKQVTPRSTAIILAIVGVLILALAVFMVTRGPDSAALPVSLGFSLNSFFVWIGNLTPLLHIPIIVAGFAVVVGIILVLVEFAPRSGAGYFALRTAACFVITVLAFMLLRPYQNAIVYVVAIALLAGALLFFADYRSRAGTGYVFQLIIFMAPAAVLILVGLIYPALSTIFQSFLDKTGKQFVGLENYVWVFTNPDGFWSVINTLIWAALAPTISIVLGLAYAVFIERARGERIL